MQGQHTMSPEICTLIRYSQFRAFHFVLRQDSGIESRTGYIPRNSRYHCQARQRPSRVLTVGAKPSKSRALLLSQ